MTDRIRIRDLSLRTIIGVQRRERRSAQTVLVNLELELDLAAPARSDDLADTTDYGVLARRVAEHVEGSRYRLLERLAGAIADLVLEAGPRVAVVTVRVDKPGALRRARSVSVELRRERER